MKEETFDGYNLIYVVTDRSIDGLGCIVKVYKNSELQFSEKVFITGTSMVVLFNNDSEKALDRLSYLAGSKAKARIIMGRYENEKEYIEYIKNVDNQSNYRNYNDDEIKYELLNSLKKLRKENPGSFKIIRMPIAGFCGILGIDKKTYEYIAGLLLEDGLIEENVSNGLNISNGGIYITNKGIEYLSFNENRSAKDINYPRKSDKKRYEYEYDVSISFAGEDRDIAKKIASSLKDKGIKVFFDEFEESSLWGKNLYDYFQHIYSEAACLCIMLISKHYANKSWPNHERKSAQARAFQQNEEYILPIRIDDTKIPGIPDTIGYLSLEQTSIEKIVELVLKKLEKLYK